MRWIHRLSQVALAVGLVGLLTMVRASAMAGWSSITVFARGLVLAAGGSLASLLLAAVAACSGSGGRRLALIEGLSALLLLGVVALLWRAA
jgi:hypothetical protein